LTGMALTAATGWLLVQQADVNYLLANLAGITLASACNFLLNIAWTWRGLMPGAGAP
jgi:putative flippase GtrA